MVPLRRSSRRRSSLPALALALLLAWPPPAGARGRRRRRAALDGRWEVVAVVVAEREMRLPPGVQTVWSFRRRDGRFAIRTRTGEGEVDVRGGTWLRRGRTITLTTARPKRRRRRGRRRRRRRPRQEIVGLRLQGDRLELARANRTLILHRLPGR